MRNKRVLLVLIIVGFCTSAVLAAPYIWNGEGVGYHWDTSNNWFALLAPPFYPSNTYCDAIIPSAESAWHVSLTNENIDDLTIGWDVDFDDADDNNPTLTVDTVTIAGGVTATIDEGATITTVQP